MRERFRHDTHYRNFQQNIQPGRLVREEGEEEEEEETIEACYRLQQRSVNRDHRGGETGGSSRDLSRASAAVDDIRRGAGGRQSGVSGGGSVSGGGRIVAGATGFGAGEDGVTVLC
jgi:hypothetical protein